MVVVVAGALGGRRYPASTECLGAKKDILRFFIYFIQYKDDR